jgi:hypothetical protein
MTSNEKSLKRLRRGRLCRTGREVEDARRGASDE